MDSGPVQALQLRDQPQPASAATGSAAANGAGSGLHVMASSLPRRLSRVCRRSGRFRRRACWPEGRRSDFGGPGSDAGGGRLLDCAQVQPAGRGSRRSSQSPHRSAVKRPPGQGAGPGGQCRQAGARPPQEPSSPPGAILSTQALIVYFPSTNPESLLHAILHLKFVSKEPKATQQYLLLHICFLQCDMDTPPVEKWASVSPLLCP
ncbi:uncharacterized protein AAG666_004476 isoform 1-T1 [Megaptera novaeangliae]